MRDAMAFLRLIRLHLQMHIWYLLLVPIAGVLSSQLGPFGRLAIQIAPVLVFERMILLETTSGVRLLRLTLPVARSGIVLADVLFCHLVVLCAFGAAMFPALVGLPSTFVPRTIDLLALLSLASLIAFSYNILGPMAATYLAAAPMVLNVLYMSVLPRVRLVVDENTYLLLLAATTVVCTVVTLTASAMRRFAPFTRLPQGD